jgi:hypothetical protein
LILSSVLRILPVIPRDDLAAVLASAFAFQPIVRIGVRQAVIKTYLITLLDIPSRDKISVLIKTQVSVAGMIKKPLHGKSIKMRSIGRNKAFLRAYAKINYLFSYASSYMAFAGRTGLS